MKKLILLIFVIYSSESLAQAQFIGNVFDNESKEAIKNVQLMIVEESDTTFVIPDHQGNFNFKTKPGRVKVYTIADGFMSELNSLNAGNGSKNQLNIGLVKEELSRSYEKKAEAIPVINMGDVDFHYSKTITDEGHSYNASDAIIKNNIEYIKDNGATKLKVGVLTAGEVNDFAKWSLWNDLTSNEFKVYSGFWKLSLRERFCIQLSLPSGMPVIDAKITLQDGSGKVIWIARTDNTGKAELWSRDSLNIRADRYAAIVEFGSYKKKFDAIHSFEEGINSLHIEVPCTVSDQLDIAFVVDATGSMGDEINYLKLDLENVISAIEKENKHINLRMGSIFYRDTGDEYVTLEAPFSNNTTLVKNFINSNIAAGGGDFPEAADEALIAAINNLNWSSTSRARIIFWLLDAPPHRGEDNLQRLILATKIAAEKGIRIVPVGCSGIDKPTEFLCRNIALATNGTYTFLTNHSGIGGTHIEPSTDGYKVESFRDVLVRISKLMSITPDCEEFISPEQIAQIDTNLHLDNPYGIKDTIYVNRTIDTLKRDRIIELEILLYPNPTNGIFHIKNPREIKEVFIADVNGKILERVPLNEEEITTCDMSKYSNGVYFVQYYNGQRWTTKRLVLNH